MNILYMWQYIMRLNKLLRLISFLVYIELVVSAPAPTLKPPEKGPPPPPDHQGMDGQPQAPSTGLYYDEYLQTIVRLLESDENFRKTMEQADFEAIKRGDLSKELYKIPSDIRDKLDDAKREEVSRLRRIMHAKVELEKGRKVSHTSYLKQIANHLDHSNPHSFEAQDLTNLIKAATKDLENFDEKRHEEFKKYEMTKELRRQEKLRQMNESDRLKAEREYAEMRKKHEDHPDMNHPGSKSQLDEIWKESDGLRDEKFDPKTFFMMHDLNNDGTLDPMELEALFEKDLAKVYDSANPEDDMIEMEAERTRMRQHVMKEVDSDQDGLISIDEFLNYTKTPEFGNPDEKSYQTVDELIDSEELYTKEELDEFKKMIEEQEQEIKQKLEELKKQAQNVVSLKSDMYNHENKVRQMGEQANEEDKSLLQEKKEQVEQEEKVLKEMHDDLKEQSKDVMEMKAEVKKQEDAVKEKTGQGEGHFVENAAPEENGKIQLQGHAPVDVANQDQLGQAPPGQPNQAMVKDEPVVH